MRCAVHHLGLIRPKPDQLLKPQCLSLWQPGRRRVDLHKLPLPGWLPLVCLNWLRLFRQLHCCRAPLSWLPVNQRILTMHHGSAA